jgi:hypothetical protein
MAIQMGSDTPQQNAPVKKNDKLGQVVLSNRCLETQAQLAMLMNVMALTSGASMARVHGEESGPHKMTEGQIALENTLVAACARADAILADATRWDNSFQTKVEKEYADLHELQMKALEAQRAFSEAQRAAAAECCTPHFRFRPDLKRLKNGQWLCILGSEDALEFAVYGIGDSAQQSIDEFDTAFTKGVPASVLSWAERREKDLEAGKTLEPPLQENNEQRNDELDAGQTGDSSEPEGQG